MFFSLVKKDSALNKMNWEYFLTIAVLFVGLAVIVAAYVYSFQQSSGKLYGSLYGGAGFVPTSTLAPTEANVDAIREAERWIQTSNREVTIWAVVFLIVALIVLFGHWRLYA